MRSSTHTGGLGNTHVFSAAGRLSGAGAGGLEGKQNVSILFVADCGFKITA